MGTPSPHASIARYVSLWTSHNGAQHVPLLFLGALVYEVAAFEHSGVLTVRQPHLKLNPNLHILLVWWPMAEEPRLLPLFPLHTVLFPGMEMPLRVFEPRYRRMLDDCMATEDRAFGIVLIRAGREVGGAAEPHGVGTIAHIEEVRPLGDGTLAVSLEGRRRFRVIELVRERQYLSAMVQALDEPTGDDVERAAQDVRVAAQQTLRRLLALNGEWVARVPLSRDALKLSYSVAERLQLDLPVRQELLEAETTSARLSLELPVLAAEGQRVEELLAQRNWLGGLALN